MADSGNTDQADQAEELARQPGQPHAADEIDPELVVLPRRRTRISPVLAGVIVVFCVYMMGRLWSDLRFSMLDDAPVALTAEAALTADRNQFVAIDATPDRANLVRVTRSRADQGHRGAPALGTDGRLWIFVDGSSWAGETHHDEVHTGRLYRLGDLPFHDELRRYVADAPPVPRPVPLSELRRGLTEGASELTSASGDHLPITADTPAIVEETVGDRALITVAATDDRAAEGAWRAALSSAGLLGASTSPISSNELSWTYEVAAPGGVDGVNAALAEAELFAARAHPLVRIHEAPWSALSLRGGELAVGDAGVPWTDVSAAAVAVRPPVPASAAALVTTERPDDAWYLVWLYAALALFALLFAWVTFRAIRRG